MFTLTNHVIAQAEFTLRGAMVLWDFRNIKFYDLSARPLALSHVLNPALVITLRSKEGQMRD